MVLGYLLKMDSLRLLETRFVLSIPAEIVPDFNYTLKLFNETIKVLGIPNERRIRNNSKNNPQSLGAVKLCNTTDL